MLFYFTEHTPYKSGYLPNEQFPPCHPEVTVVSQVSVEVMDFVLSIQMYVREIPIRTNSVLGNMGSRP